MCGILLPDSKRGINVPQDECENPRPVSALFVGFQPLRSPWSHDRQGLDDAAAAELMAGIVTRSA
jgi:hypothetical protein